MFAIHKANASVLATVFVWLAGVFGAMSFALALFLENGPSIKLAVIFTLGVSIGCTLVIAILLMILSIKENVFFNRYPFNFIGKRTVKSEFLRDSKFEFFTKHRFFTLDEVDYQAAFYSETLRNSYGNALLIKTTDALGKQFVRVIEYKEKQLDVFGLIAEIKSTTL